MKQRLHLALLIGLGSLSIIGNSWGQAVSVDAGSLMKRLDAIETRLDTVEKRKSGGSAVSAGGAAGSYSAADLEQRMEDLEQESSQVRGGNDRATQAIEHLAKKFDDYVKDMDMRMGDIETRMDALSKKVDEQKAAAVAPAEAEAPVAAAKDDDAPAATPAASKGTATPVPVGLNASDHYNKAYAYLTATDYKNAQVWFEEFLKRHPTDALADNAYYWLGEVYLVQNNPSAAVGKFRDGYKAFPKGGKAAANLFKMGVALEQLKQPKLAQASWEKVLKDYPTAPEAARAKDKLLLLKQKTTTKTAA